MTISFQIILYKNKIMLHISFRLIGMDEVEIYPPHFWFYKIFISSFHRTIEQPGLEGTSKDRLTQPFFLDADRKTKSS